MNKTAARGNDGFTLIEVLVALVILGISLATLLHIFSESLNRARLSQTEMAASALAQSLLAGAGHTLPLRAGDTTGELPNGFTWRLHIEPYGSEDDRKSWQMGAVSISASVAWNDGGRKHSMTLTTLRAVAKETAQ